MHTPYKTLLLQALLLSALCTASASNPLNLGSEILTADPSAHVWEDGRIYLYTSHDLECQEDFWMKDWHVFSSDDLTHWTDHGACLSVDELDWADNYAWAPDCAYKDGMYYFCFPAGTGYKDRVNPENSTKWMGLGIAASTSPTGPFEDIIGAPLFTDPYANDPCLFVDTDGQAYLYFHGAKGSDWLVAKMADDMKRIEGDFIRMDMGGYEPKMEGPWVFKRNDTYYFTMPENNRKLTYYMSDSPTGPWEYKGLIMDGEGNANNHHSIVEFKGQWILFYHRWLPNESDCGKAQRRVCAEYLQFNEDGTIQPVKRSYAGLDK